MVVGPPSRIYTTVKQYGGKKETEEITNDKNMRDGNNSDGRGREPIVGLQSNLYYAQSEWYFEKNSLNKIILFWKNLQIYHWKTRFYYAKCMQIVILRKIPNNNVL